MKKLIFASCVVVMISNSHAGLKELTWHSRANCLGINESITWHLNHSPILNTTSTHSINAKVIKEHTLSTGFVVTWRSAVVHWTEGMGLWKVAGKHYKLDKLRQPRFLGSTEALDCSIYDGWWDQKRPPPIDENYENGDINVQSLSVSNSEQGIHIIPASQMGIPKELMRKEINEIKEMKQKGYIEKPSNDAAELIKMGHSSFYFDDNDDKRYETDLKRTLSKIKLGFKFSGIPGIKPSDIIGYAAAGTPLKDKGWTGIGVYFKYNPVGVCHYLAENIALSGGGMTLREDLVSYEINNKPTNKSIEGNAKSGFLYSITWYDNTFIQTLECAITDYKENVIPQIINLASKIDKR